MHKIDYIQNLATATVPLPEIPSDSILSHTIYKDEQVKVILFSFAATQELSEHTAAVPAIIHVLDGEAEIKVGGELHYSAAGTWMHLPPNMPHTIIAKTPMTMLLYLLPNKNK